MNIMMNSIQRQRTVFLLSGIALAISTPNAFATDGIYFTGNGAISSGMGGAAIALPQDVASAVDNPAGLAELGARVDFYGTLIPLTADSTFGSTGNHLFSSRVIVSPGLGLNYQIAP
jgi:long-chain fatty acid transport protein